MTDRYVVHSGGLSSGAAATLGAAWSLAYFNTTAVAGDRALMQTGDYANQKMQPHNSGTSEANRIIYYADGAGVQFNTTSGATFECLNFGAGLPKLWISVIGISFYNTGGMWINCAGASTRFTVSGCTFHSGNPAGDTWDHIPQAFTGIVCRGAYARLESNIFKTWMGGDNMNMYGDYAYVGYNDMNLNDNGHGSIVMYGNYFVVERNYIRNKWARACHFAPVRLSAADQLEGVVQDNIIFDCNYTDASNEGYPPTGGWMVSPYNAAGPIPYAIGDGDPPGDGQMVKGGGTGLIFRNNIIVATNPANFQGAPGFGYVNNLQINNYESTIYYREGRYYHNTFYDNAFHGITVNAEPSTPRDLSDNRFFNNVFHNLNNYAFWLPNSPAQSPTLAAQQQYRNNIMTLPINFAGTTYTATQLNTSQPAVAAGNISSTPVFVNPTYTTASRTTLGNRVTIDQFALGPTSPGYTSARHLTHLTVAATNTQRLFVEDAYFFTNGNGIIGGDVIIVNGITCTVTAANKSAASPYLDVNQFVTAPINTPVWLAKFGTAPAIGVKALAAPQVDPVISDLSLLRISGTTTPAQAYTIDQSVTVAGNSIVVAVIGYRYPSNTNIPTISIVTSTFATIGGWTQRIVTVRESTISTILAIYTAQIGSNSASGTVTATTTGGVPSGWKMALCQADTHDIAIPVIQAIGTYNFATTLSMNLAATPLIGSMVIGAMFSRGDTDGVTPTSGYTELVDDVTGTVPLEVVWDKTSPSATLSWSSLLTNANMAVAIEIAVADASTSYLFPIGILVDDYTIPALTFGQIYVLNAQAITTGTPSVGAMAFGQKHALNAQTITTAAPTVGSLTFGQVHQLNAQSITTSAPTVDAMGFAVTAPDEFIFVPLVTGAPTVGAMTFGQVHSLSLPAALDTAPPSVGALTFGQVHSLNMSAIDAGAPDVGELAFGQISVLEPTGITTAAPTVDAMTFGQIHELNLQSITSGAPIIQGTSVHVLGAFVFVPILTGYPVIDALELTLVFSVEPADIITGAPTVGSMSFFPSISGPPPAERTYIVPAEDRVYVVPHEDRVYVVR